VNGARLGGLKEPALAAPPIAVGRPRTSRYGGAGGRPGGRWAQIARGVARASRMADGACKDGIEQLRMPVA